MSSTAKQKLCKQPGEKRKFSMDFSNMLAASETISTISSITTEEINGGTSDLTTSGQAISGSNVEVFIQSGTSGKTYRIQITITTSGSQILQGDGILYVSDR
tara:strand:+ start:1948 stop:2253 length:306 start_codon:yes stop_codon:yes gene_type:complete